MTDTTAPHDPVDLHATATALLEQARTARAGRAAKNLTPGAGAHLTQTVLALAAGQRLEEHSAPGPATLQVIAGTLALTTGADEVMLSAGDWTTIPEEVHGLRADSDAVLLLTVASAQDVKGP